MSEARAERVYQRWIEVDPPAGVGSGPPMWSWPVALSDGRVVLTLLYRPLGAMGSARKAPVTQVLELSAEGEARVWGPGVGYPSPVMFYADEGDVLFGLDLALPGKVYACRVDGTHVATLAMSVRMGSLISPERFFVRGGEVFWIDARRRAMRGVMRGGRLEEEREISELPADEGDVRFPHTHVTRGSLFVLEWDVMGRVSRYRLSG